MYGLHVHRAVLAAGEAKTGASVHVVTEEYDAGSVIAQSEVAVEPTDTTGDVGGACPGAGAKLVGGGSRADCRRAPRPA